MNGWQKVDGQKLRALRERLMVSQRELAELAGTTQVTISLLEQGKRDAQPRTLRHLAAALGIAPLELVKQQDPPS